MQKYDYLIVGSGIFGATFARLAKDAGKSVLVVEKRNHIGGNCYTEEVEGIQVHKYGPHIFHTNSKKAWDFITRFADFNRFTNSPIAKLHNGKIVQLPFNMRTFYDLFGVTDPNEAADIIAREIADAEIDTPKNLEEQAIKMVGRTVYEILIKGYTEKQWGKKCTELPPEIIRRIPVRFTYDGDYFGDLYQGIPVEGYTRMFERLLDGIEVVTDYDYLLHRDICREKANTIVYTGPIDAFFGYELGYLEYRTVRLRQRVLDKINYQGNAVVNYPDVRDPWTRIIEHKWFNPSTAENIMKTVVSVEVSERWEPGKEELYPINDSRNNSLYRSYRKQADSYQNIIFGGRLAEYRYYNMDQAILSAMNMFEELN